MSWAAKKRNMWLSANCWGGLIVTKGYLFDKFQEAPEIVGLFPRELSPARWSGKRLQAKIIHPISRKDTGALHVFLIDRRGKK